MRSCAGESTLKCDVFGQDETVERVAGGVRVFRIARRGRKPLSYFFLGPSGVGKTQLTKGLAKVLFDDENAMLRFDMADYMEKHAVAKLIGAPPGYEGFEAGGLLTNAMRRSSYRVILMDEAEKAHPDVFNVLLSVLDDGRLTDNVGRVIQFGEAIIVLTSNVGQTHFLNPDISFEEACALATEDLARIFPSELLNRFNGRQNILCFRPLGLDSMARIVARELGSLEGIYAPLGVTSRPDAVLDFCRDQYDPKTGARGLPGLITATLEPQLADRVLANLGGVANVGYDGVSHRLTVDFT